PALNKLAAREAGLGDRGVGVTGLREVTARIAHRRLDGPKFGFECQNFTVGRSLSLVPPEESGADKEVCRTRYASSRSKTSVPPLSLLRRPRPQTPFGDPPRHFSSRGVQTQQGSGAEAFGHRRGSCIEAATHQRVS